MFYKKSKIEQAFWKLVKEMPNGCWEWQGTRTSGYGQFSFGGIRWNQSHRLAYCLFHDIDDLDELEGMVIMHTCDNPPCVNPSHLKLGTNLENTRDAFAKGRRGGKPSWAKLDWEAVRYIRSTYNGDYTPFVTRMVEELNVSRAAIRQVLLNKAWFDPEYRGIEVGPKGPLGYKRRSPKKYTRHRGIQ